MVGKNFDEFHVYKKCDISLWNGNTFFNFMISQNCDSLASLNTLPFLTLQRFRYHEHSINHSEHCDALNNSITQLSLKSVELDPEPFVPCNLPFEYFIAAEINDILSSFEYLKKPAEETEIFKKLLLVSSYLRYKILEASRFTLDLKRLEWYSFIYKVHLININTVRKLSDIIYLERTRVYPPFNFLPTQDRLKALTPFTNPTTFHDLFKLYSTTYNEAIKDRTFASVNKLINSTFGWTWATWLNNRNHILSNKVGIFPAEFTSLTPIEQFGMRVRHLTETIEGVDRDGILFIL